MDSIQQKFYGDQPECFTYNIQDTLNSLYQTRILDSINQSVSFTINTDSGKMEKMKIEELYSKSADELIEDLELTKWIDKLSIRQAKRFVDDPNALIRASIGNMIWKVLLLMPTIALFLKLLYFHHGFYYVEHMVFSFHFNSYAFLHMGLIVWIYDVQFSSILIGNLVIIIFLFLALLSFYKQSIFRTFVKCFLLIWSYFLVAIFFLAIMLGLSFILF